MHTFANGGTAMSQDTNNSPPENKGNIQELFQSDNQNDFVSAVRLAASRILNSLHVEEERLDEILGEVETDSFYVDFKNSWEDLAAEFRDTQLSRRTGRTWKAKTYSTGGGPLMGVVLHCPVDVSGHA